MKKFKRLLSLLLVCCLVMGCLPMAAVAGDTTTIIPEDAMEFNGHFYKVFDDSLTWEEAKEYCESLGGYLATITSLDEQEFINDIVADVTQPYVRIGLYRETGKDLSWITGESSDYTNWAVGEPNNIRGEEYYGMIYTSTATGFVLGTWNDTGTTYPNSDFAFICEWGAFSPTKTDISYNVGDIIKFGRYKQSAIRNGSGEVVGFNEDPIKWRILKIEDGRALLLSSEVIDSKQYNSTSETVDGYYGNNYAHSDIRRWLVNDFYNTAFSSSEKDIILETTLDNSACATSFNASGSYTKYSSEPTTDKVFFLSKSEAETYASKYYQTTVTDYAYANKCTDPSWFLRTAGNNTYQIWTVHNRFGEYIPYFNWYDDFITALSGVRPAIYIDLASYKGYSDGSGEAGGGNLPIEDFNITIYRANHLVNDSVTAQTLQQNSPCRIMIPELKKSGMDDTAKMWQTMNLLFNTLDDVTTLSDFVMEPKDMYSAIIMNALHVSVSGDIIPSEMEDGVRLCDDIISSVSNVMKVKYGIDVLDSNAFQLLTSAQEKTLQDAMDDWFTENQPDLKEFSSAFGGIGKGIKWLGSIENYVEHITACMLLAKSGEGMRDVLTTAYQKSLSTNNIYLIAALQECVEIINSSMDEIYQKILVDGFVIVGTEATKYLIDELLWSTVKKKIYAMCPEVAILQLVYQGGKFVTNEVFKTEDTIEQYLKMLATADVETLFEDAYSNLQSAYVSERNVRHADAYLRGMSILFELRDVDCDSAYQYYDICDDALLNKFLHLFGQADYSAVKSYISEMKSNYTASHIVAETGWIPYLLDDYPNSGLYEKYNYLLEEVRNRILKKEFYIACPVNVYVCDKSNNVVASVENGRVSCQADDVMIALIGDEKMIRFYNDADYHMEYVGYDTGDMDVTITEYDKNESIVRTVNYYDVELNDGKTYAIEANNQILKPYTLEDKTDNAAVEHDYDSMDTNTTRSVTVLSGTMVQNGNICTETTAQKGETIELNAYVPEGYEFVRWESTDETAVIADDSSTNTAIVIGDDDVIVTAVMNAPEGGVKTTATITGVSANNSTYTGNPQPGYTGTPTSAYAGEYEFLYTGRNSTTYNSASAPTNAGDYTVTIKIPDSDTTYTGSVSLDFSIAKANQIAPSAPELESKTSNSITLKAIAPNANSAAAEYSKDNGSNWQSSPTFTGLTADTEYSFVARYAETENYKESPASSALKVTTDVALAPEKGEQVAPSAPELESKTSNSITLKAIAPNANGAAAEYSKDNGSNWQSSPTFTGLTADTEYSFVARYAETESYKESPISASLKVATDGSSVGDGGSGGSNSGSAGSGGSGSPAPTTPTVIVGEGGTAELSFDGTTLTITPDEGYEIKGVLKNGISQGTVSQLTGLQSEDVIEITFAKVQQMSYTDVPKNAWFYESVKYVTENGLMSGFGNGKFGPNDKLTRAQLTQILYNKEGRPNVSPDSGFVDVAKDMWYAKAISWAAQNDIVTGYGGKRFGPNNLITREQLATILWRYDGSPEVSGNLDHFIDGNKTSTWAVSAMQWAVAEGIMNGNGNGTITPTGKATRAEVATMMKNYCKKK